MRDRDVRNAMQAALAATGAFDAVWLWGLPEAHGSGASRLAIATIEPVSSVQDDRWDSAATGSLVVTSQVAITLLARHEDPQTRDENAELLLDVVANALNGQSLAGFTIPELTRLASWRWSPPSAPERRVEAIFGYQYIVDFWNSYDLTP